MESPDKKLSFEELINCDTCPCEVCINNPQVSVELDEAFDLFADSVIDYLIDNPNKDILKELPQQANL